MLAQTVWKNVMLLHHGVAVYEIRNRLGYGMRWTLDIEERKSHLRGEESLDKDAASDNIEKEWEITKTTFRGFLEPIAEMDHELPNHDVDSLIARSTQ